jgi:hypothetical protein
MGKISRFLFGGVPKSGIPTKAQRAYYTANIAGTVPGTSVLGEIGTRVGSSLLKRAGSQIVRTGVRRFFRTIKGKFSAIAKPGVGTARRAAVGGSKITSGKLILGPKQAFKAGGTAFNVRMAGKAGVALAGVGAGAVALGKQVKPSAAVSVASAHVVPAGAAHAAPVASARTASSPSPAMGSSSSSKRCGCPPGQRMLCFKRKHNPQAEAKRRAKRKAAAAKSKAKTAKRTAKAKAAVARRKSARTARKVRKAASRVLRGRRK